MIFQFSHLGYLWLLLLVPLLIFIHFISLKMEKSKAVKFANFDAIARISGIDLYSKNIVVLFIAILILILLVLALSGLSVNAAIQTSKMSFVIAIDTSKSMEATDFSPTRLGAAKQIASDFVNGGKFGSEVGIISFSGNSFIEQEVTADKELLKSAIEKTDFKDLGGTDIAEAIVTSVNLLGTRENKAILLLSDGQINVDGIESAINYANKQGVIIHTVAIGTSQGGMTGFGISKVDEDSLKSLAYNTGGSFFSAANNADLQDSFTKISQLEIANKNIDLSSYLLMAAIVIFIVEFFLVNTRYRQIP